MSNPQDPDLGATPAGRRASAGTRGKTDVMLAEYSALRAEIERRANVQWNVFALQITSAGVISSLAISSSSKIALLLLVPLSSYMLGSRYILHDYHIKLIGSYISESLSGRLGGALQWEGWKKDRLRAEERQHRLPAVAAWKMTQPTRLAFEGVAWLALAVAIPAAWYAWRHNAPAWYLVLGFALLWCLGAIAAYRLHASFNESDAEKPTWSFGQWFRRRLARKRSGAAEEAPRFVRIKGFARSGWRRRQ